MCEDIWSTINYQLSTFRYQRSAIQLSVCVPPDQIQQGEQEDPDDVDEVPVEDADFDRAVVFLRDGAAPGPREHHQHNADADDHVHRVQPGHDEVEREED